MELVIEIDEESYNEIKKIVADGNEMCFMQTLIANGTPLPKGHGRLIDAAALVYSSNKESINMYEIGFAPTIIEADKED